MRHNPTVTAHPRTCFFAAILIIIIYAGNVVSGQRGFYGKNDLLPICQVNELHVISKLQLPGAIIITEDAENICFTLPDHLGSGRIIADTSGTLRSACTYDPYGAINSKNTDNKGTEHKYTGTYTWNSISRMYSSPTRKYDPVIKTFLSADGIRSTPSVYAYANNNPIRFSDPSGQMPELPSLSRLIVDRFWKVPDLLPSELEWRNMRPGTGNFQRDLEHLQLIRGVAQMSERFRQFDEPADVEMPGVMTRAMNAFISENSTADMEGLDEIEADRYSPVVTTFFSSYEFGVLRIFEGGQQVKYGNPLFNKYLWQMDNYQHFFQLARENAVLSLAKRIPLPQTVFTDLIAMHLIRVSEHHQLISSVEIYKHLNTGEEAIWISRVGSPHNRLQTHLLDVTKGVTYKIDELYQPANRHIADRYLPLIPGNRDLWTPADIELVRQKTGAIQSLFFRRY